MTAKITRTWKDFEKTFVNIDRKINNTYSPKLSSAKVIYDDIDEKIKKLQEKHHKEQQTSSYLLWFWQSRARLFSCFATSGWSLPKTFTTSSNPHYQQQLITDYENLNGSCDAEHAPWTVSIGVITETSIDLFHSIQTATEFLLNTITFNNTINYSTDNN